MLVLFLLRTGQSATHIFVPDGFFCQSMHDVSEVKSEVKREAQHEVESEVKSEVKSDVESEVESEVKRHIES